MFTPFNYFDQFKDKDISFRCVLDTHIPEWEGPQFIVIIQDNKLGTDLDSLTFSRNKLDYKILGTVLQNKFISDIDFGELDESALDKYGRKISFKTLKNLIEDRENYCVYEHYRNPVLGKIEQESILNYNYRTELYKLLDKKFKDFENDKKKLLEEKQIKLKYESDKIENERVFDRLIRDSNTPKEVKEWLSKQRSQ